MILFQLKKILLNVQLFIYLVLFQFFLEKPSARIYIEQKLKTNRQMQRTKQKTRATVAADKVALREKKKHLLISKVQVC